MKKILLYLISVMVITTLIITIGMTGCKKEQVTETTAAETTGAETTTGIPKIGYISRLAVPWWIIADEGFKAAGKEFGFEAVIYDPPELTVEDQVRTMETWLASDFNGVFFAPNDPAAPISVINKGIDNKIPVKILTIF